jgi:hypothetical protein
MPAPSPLRNLSSCVAADPSSGIADRQDAGRRGAAVDIPLVAEFILSITKGRPDGMTNRR